MKQFELIIMSDQIDQVFIPVDGKMKEINISDTDSVLKAKIDNVTRWLRIHPISGGKYIMSETEYQEYKEFMENKMYLIDMSNILLNRR